MTNNCRRTISTCNQNHVRNVYHAQLTTQHKTNHMYKKFDNCASLFLSYCHISFWPAKLLKNWFRHDQTANLINLLCHHSRGLIFSLMKDKKILSLSLE